VLDWLAPCFGMSGGLLTPGSTLANLTAIWAAREITGIRRVVASSEAHLSIRKAARLLGLALVEIPAAPDDTLDSWKLPDDLSDACVVLTAGTTNVGAIDPLELIGRARWTHVDGAWGAPLRLSATRAPKLAGIEHADSISISAHKLLFQPKDSAIVLFRDALQASEALQFEAGYLAVPNVGILGSHGAMAVPLLATLLAWGRDGLAARIDRCIDGADVLADSIGRRDDLELRRYHGTGIVVWRSRCGVDVDALVAALPPGSASAPTIAGQRWVRHVAANPCADPAALIDAIGAAVSNHPRGA
jgi:L-2,4-diaminobutyrate decarboxylase